MCSIPRCGSWDTHSPARQQIPHVLSYRSIVDQQRNWKLLQAQLGHANVQITADVYTRVDETQKKRAAEARERGVLGNL
jgi:integrase